MQLECILPSYLFPTIQVTPASMMNQYGAMNQYEYINVVIKFLCQQFLAIVDSDSCGGLFKWTRANMTMSAWQASLAKQIYQEKVPNKATLKIHYKGC